VNDTIKNMVLLKSITTKQLMLRKSYKLMSRYEGKRYWVTYSSRRPLTFKSRNTNKIYKLEVELLLHYDSNNYVSWNSYCQSIATEGIFLENNFNILKHDKSSFRMFPPNPGFEIKYSINTYYIDENGKKQNAIPDSSNNIDIDIIYITDKNFDKAILQVIAP